MAKGKETVWEKVSFSKKKESAPECILSFRANGQVIINEETMKALGFPEYINFFASHSGNLIAMQATGKDDVDAIRVNRGKDDKSPTGMFTNRTVYQWICGLLKQEDVLVSLAGVAEDNKVVFDLKKAQIKPKRTIQRKK